MRYYNENYVVNEYGELFSLFSGRLKKLKPYFNHRGYAYRKWLAKRGLPTKYKDIKSFIMSV